MFLCLLIRSGRLGKESDFWNVRRTREGKGKLDGMDGILVLVMITTILEFLFYFGFFLCFFLAIFYFAIAFDYFLYIFCCGNQSFCN